jgi:septum formation protein
VTFAELSHDDVDNYLASGEWSGKAGGYAIQGLAGTFVTALEGSWSNVVGLPTEALTALLSTVNP